MSNERLIPDRFAARSTIPFAGFAILGLAVAIFLARGVPMRVFGAAGAVLFAFLAVRASRSGMTLTSEGLASRNERGTVRLSWAEVDHFEVRRFGALVAVRNDANAVRLRDFAPFRTAAMEETARTLNQELARYRGSPNP